MAISEQLAAYQQRRRDHGETGLTFEIDVLPIWGGGFQIQWVLRGDLGAIHFHADFSTNPDRDADLRDHGRYGGVEAHRVEPPGYPTGMVRHCPKLLDGYCYTDGSSMVGVNMVTWYAETLPMAAMCRNGIIAQLERLYHDWFKSEEVVS